jgi:hypothetical protein
VLTVTEEPEVYGRLLGEISTRLGAMGAVVSDAFASAEGDGPLEVYVCLAESVWNSQDQFSQALRELSELGRRVTASLRIGFFHPDDRLPPGIAAAARAAVHLAGQPLHRELRTQKALEAPACCLPVSAIQYWRQVAWRAGSPAMLARADLDAMARLLRASAAHACGAAGEWLSGATAIAGLRRRFPDLAGTLDDFQQARAAMSEAPEQQAALRRCRTATLLFAEDLADRTIPFIPVLHVQRTAEALRTAARAPAPVLTPEAESAAALVRSRLRSALLALLAVRTPLQPLALVAVLDDLMPAPSLRLLELAPPTGAADPPVLFLRQSELPLLGTGVWARQPLFRSYLFPYVTTALFAGSRLLHGEELRPTLPLPDRSVAGAAVLADLQHYVRTELMAAPPGGGARPGGGAHTAARAEAEMAHLLALGLWLQSDDGIETANLLPAFLRAYPDFPHRQELKAADYARDPLGWSWAWEQTCRWLRRRVEAMLPPDLQAEI